MSVTRKNRTFRHLVVFALERYFLEKQGNIEGLKGFKTKLLRMALSLSYDKKLDKKAGADSAYFNQVEAAWHQIKTMSTSSAPLLTASRASATLALGVI